jgi:phospholipid/cholesterol/gamma-HCH transport system substrate-binding protein
MTARRSTRATRATVVVAGVLLASGCSATLDDVPIPGSGVAGETITIKADFEEALNLARGAPVKVNGVDSGRVQQVVVDDFQAQAEMLVEEDAGLRQGATARLRYTTPLGELFVDVTNPPAGPPLADGAVLTTRHTSTAPTVEDALSQASLLVNGGGLAQLQTVTEELNAIIGGREDEVRSLLEGSASFLTEANATTADIDRALRSLASVATTLRARERVIARALREIRPAARVLRQNTPGLARLLREIERFSAVADETVRLTRSQLLGMIRQAQPVLAELTRHPGEYAASLEQLVALGGHVDNIVPADYVSISLALHLDNVRLPALGGVLDDVLGLDLPLLRAGDSHRAESRPTRAGR